MNRYRIMLCGCLIAAAGIGLAMLTLPASVAQAPFNQNALGNADMKGVPPSALLTDRGQGLANRLRNLRRSRDVMGPKHPSLDSVNKEIKAIEEQLQAWAPANEPPEANPFSPEAKQKAKNAKARPRMNEVDLRQIVLKLNEKVLALEKRVAVLEAR